MRISCAHGSQLDLPSEVLIYDTVLRLMAGKESLQAFEGWLKEPSSFGLSIKPALSWQGTLSRVETCRGFSLRMALREVLREGYFVCEGTARS